MNARDFGQLALFIGGLLAITPPLGRFMVRVFGGERHFLSRLFGPIERSIYKLSGVDPTNEMSWKAYAMAMLVFNIAGGALLLVMELTQQWLPFNPQHLPNVPFALAFDTAVSFTTNTNWQAYSGENTMSYFTQMAGLAVHNFVSAATGIAVAVALARGLVRKQASGIGNFWADLTRGTLYILLPLSILIAVVLAQQGVVQTFDGYPTATTLEGASQQIPLGPVASQIAIKQLGTNGGGFFGQNSAHPFENPTPLSNFVEIFVIFSLGSALVYMFGLMARDRRQGWAIWAAMFALFLAGFATLWWAELQPNPALGLTAPSLEGKEVRFGQFNSALFATVTTDASCGAVNMMHDSLTPLGGLVPFINMMLGEVIFGGVGAGFYGMLMFVLLTVFIAGLMVGRTPEYLGKKIEAREVTWAVIAVLAPAVVTLCGSALTMLYPAALNSLNNGGPHGLSEVVYAFASAAANNGSAFAGINANTDWYNYMLAINMFVGRFAIIVPVLAIAGSLAQKKTSPPSSGTFPTNGPVFTVLLISVVLIVGALTFFPVLSLGSVVEHFLMQAGRTF
ncbi:MAG TPA: potassium-transporting ATPase subunit KdpA [Chthoniobacterales bacterium]|nr:potassium-transporting ATPase subunit KdpA [Chthoniobacterales bacterium]